MPQTILQQYSLLALATCLIAIFYLTTTVMVGYTRTKTKIQPPAMTGNIELEKAVRVQMNNLENMIYFLPMVWLFGFFVNSFWGGIVALLWLLGRIIYSIGYYRDVKSRSLGSIFYAPSILIVIFGTLYGVIMTMIK